MIVCICNNISEQDLLDNPDLAILVGSVCGICIKCNKVED
jgi:bacterioferritin-associated ferredoxin